MAKNLRRSLGEISKVSAVPRFRGVSGRGKKIICSGIVFLILGFWILTLADPSGRNWASTLSSFFLVLGYVLIGVGIVFPDPVFSDSSSPHV